MTRCVLHSVMVLLGSWLLKHGSLAMTVVKLFSSKDRYCLVQVDAWWGRRARHVWVDGREQRLGGERLSQPPKHVDIHPIW